jgi:hypothetical protein
LRRIQPDITVAVWFHRCLQSDRGDNCLENSQLADYQRLWGRGNWVATSGNVTDEMWKKYIEDQKREVPDAYFKVV